MVYSIKNLIAKATITDAIKNTDSEANILANFVKAFTYVIRYLAVPEIYVHTGSK